MKLEKDFCMDLKKEIIEIIKEIDKDMLSAEDGMSVYDCFDFEEKNNKKIASYINDTINEMVCCGDKGLRRLCNAILYCDCVVIGFILEKLEQKKLITSSLLEQLKKNLEEADKIYTEEMKKQTRSIEEAVKDIPYLSELLERVKKKCNED